MVFTHLNHNTMPASGKKARLGRCDKVLRPDGGKCLSLIHIVSFDLSISLYLHRKGPLTLKLRLPFSDVVNILAANEDR